MEIIIDNDEFCIRLYQNVAYLKVRGIQDQTGADFFEKTVDELIEKYSLDRFASLCDLTEMILPQPSVSRQVNNAVVKLSKNLNLGHNAIIVEAKFMQLMKAYVFSIYLRNITAETKIFKKENKAIEWLKELGYQIEEIENFLTGQKIIVEKKS